MPYRTKDEIAHRIAELRAQHGVSQRELADAIEIDQSALSRAETGDRALAVTELVAIADHLGVHVDAILRDEDATVAFRADANEEAHAAVERFDRVIEDFFALEAAAQ